MNFYSTALARELTRDQVRSQFGFYPDNYDINILNDLYGLFPINDAGEPVRDTNLYSGFANSYAPNIDGNTYDKVYSFVERPLADAQANAIAKLNDQAEYDSIVALGGVPEIRSLEFDAFFPNGPYEKVGGESEVILTTQSYLTAANRIEPYKTIAVNINAIATQLQADIAAVNAATDVDGVRLAYAPVSGDIDITRSGNNIVSGIFNTLDGATFGEMSLVVLNTGYVSYYDENNGGFTSLGGELGSGVSDVELYVGATLLATFTIPSGNNTTNFTF